MTDTTEPSRAAPLSIAPLARLVGREQHLTALSAALRSLLEAARPPVVGALHVTCSDEAEHEAAEAFRRHFVQPNLPDLRFDEKAPFRTANLGARYEPGSAGIAEDRFAAACGPDDWQLFVVKVNAHCGVDPIPGEPRFGRLARYGKPSPCCGFLQALLSGSDNPLIPPVAEAFRSDGFDRLAWLRSAAVDDRALLAAAVAARLQARAALEDVLAREPLRPTLVLVLPSVSLNRHDEHTELLLGIEVCDRRDARKSTYYTGLGDRPDAYVLSGEPGSLQLAEKP